MKNIQGMRGRMGMQAGSLRKCGRKEDCGMGRATCMGGPERLPWKRRMGAMRDPELARALLQGVRIEAAGPESDADRKQQPAEHPLTELLGVPGVILFEIKR
ncbi:hypothetical protein ACP_1636 [Acidobacterium capsulatum ATCC 51196]|uniref:Uncharacterized protein n=1 Tax=Acidobacterium capsulatum (strain ATCC 51196 / DSM 11244 / BCRC 80197 / JCM 7670 / NBRC 15755 / NCIMB 13165 / 161) TaxID=240015 RepID=C1F780_ACIC5|nr:hypothetical protein ACP_1636 [Acidobacterium capsulatum ATCC 51196]